MAVEGVGWGVVLVVVMLASVTTGQDLGLPSTDVPTSMLAGITACSIDDTDVEEVTHTTPLGTVVGRREATLGTRPTNTHLYAFRGIPYAEPPVGTLRWADPVDLVGPWPEGHLDATTYRPFCPQYDSQSHRVFGSEDCLYLNVFTLFLPGSAEAKSRNGLLPVLVFIHGGAYIRGSSSAHGPARLLAHDIVLVTLNYRLGALGYLTTEDETLPGNYGILDQVSALRWVQANVAYFGGDPKQVTIGGFSVGSSSVHMHMMSPLSRGLFHRGIMMSLSATCLGSIQSNRRRSAVELAQRLDCPSSPSSALKTCLASVPTNEIVEAQASLHKFEFWPMPFSVVVDAGLRPSPLLPGPIDSLTPTNIPLLMGGVPNEGLLFAGTMLMLAKQPVNVTALYEEAVPYIFTLWPEDKYQRLMMEVAEAFYFSKYAKTSMNIFLEEMTETLSDHNLGFCVWDDAESFARGGLTVYAYLFTHRDPDTPVWAMPIYELLRQMGITSTLLKEGVSHGDDLNLLFDFPISRGKLTRGDQTVSDLLTSMWSNFVITGSPQRSGDATSQLPPWTPVQPDQPVAYYKISVTPTMVHTPYRQKEYNLWLQVLPKLGESPRYYCTREAEETCRRDP